MHPRKPAPLGSRDVPFCDIFARPQTPAEFIEACLRERKDGPCVSMVLWVLSAEVIGRFNDLTAVVRHYKSTFRLNLTDQEMADLVELLKSL